MDNKRYLELATKRERGKLTQKEYREWLELVNESFSINAKNTIINCLKEFGVDRPN